MRKQRFHNGLATALLLALLVLTLGWLGWLILGGFGVGLLSALLLAAALLSHPGVYGRLLLRWHGARPLAYWQAPLLAQRVSQLSRRAGLRKVPQLHYQPSPLPNAMATGTPDDPLLVVTDGLVRHLSPRELDGVLAHELSHLVHDDVWVMGFADTLRRATAVLALVGQVLLLLSIPALLSGWVSLPWWLVGSILLGPALVDLVVLALARIREFEADRAAAGLTGDPLGLASALARIDFLSRCVFGLRDWVPTLLRTHPDLGSRVRRLKSLALARGL